MEGRRDEVGGTPPPPLWPIRQSSPPPIRRAGSKCYIKRAKIVQTPRVFPPKPPYENPRSWHSVVTDCYPRTRPGKTL